MRNNAAKVILLVLFILFSVVSAAVSNDQLVAFYPFSGNADDESGYGNHGTVYNALLTSDRFGMTDRAYYFNGIDAYVEVQNSTSLILSESLSISSWIQLENTSSEFKLILRKGRLNAGSSDSSYAFYVRSYDELAFYFSGSTGVHETTGVDLNDTDWYHVAVTFDSVAQEVKIFLDGIVVYSQPETGFPSEFDYPIGIGQTNDPGQFFEGNLDQLRIYSRALSEQEIQEIFDSVVFVDGFESGSLSAWY